MPFPPSSGRQLLLLALFGALAIRPLSAAGPATTFKPDPEGFIRHWLVLDPMQLSPIDDETEAIIKPIFERSYVREVSVNPQAGDRLALDGKSYLWKAEQSDTFDLDLSTVLIGRNKETDNTLILGVVYVWCPAAISGVKLAIGSDDSSAWWVNGAVVIRAYAMRSVDKDSDFSAPLNLKAGLNVLRFAVVNGSGELGCCARFVDSAGRPVTGLTLTVAPTR